MIEHVSLDHGWYYFYRVNKEKINQLPISLQNFLNDMLENCPDEKFKTGPRSSKLRFNLGIEPTEVDTHPVVRMAEEGLNWGHYKTAHSNVQMHMMHNDPQSFAVEAPIWLEEPEKPKDMFEPGPLSGHIDLLRFEDNKIWIWDFKPKAAKEKYATTQTFFYALMLSKRSGLPIENFMCGYFDEKTSYIFKPEPKILDNFIKN